MDRKLLRKMDYPSCARECLSKIENLIINRTKQDLAMDLISEFVFCEKQHLSSSSNVIQEFQLVIVLCEYFSKPVPDVTRNAVFLFLFSGNISKSRISVLVKLISTSVSCSISPILCASGTWMQQLGCTSQTSLEVAQNLVTDFVVFSRKPSEQLNSINMLAPNFAANFMTAVTELYLNELENDEIITPPEILLDVFTEWVSDKSLCLSSQQISVLPTGAIAMPVLTPLAGLIRWCVLSPLCNDNTIEAYSKLHLAILQSLLQTPITSGLPTALNVQHLISIINLLQKKIDEYIKNGINPDTDERIQISLERFAQSIQVANKSRCIYGVLPQLMSKLETLPKNTLLELVINSNRG